MSPLPMCFISFFFFNDTATTEIYTLSLHDALPISVIPEQDSAAQIQHDDGVLRKIRSEEHTSELQSPMYLVCRLLLAKKISKQDGGPEVQARTHLACRVLLDDRL